MKAINLLALLLISSSMLFAASEGDGRKWTDLGQTLHLESKKPVPREIKVLLKKHSFSGTHISSEQFLKTGISELNKRIPADYLIFNYPDNPYIADEFIYSVIKEKESDRFWIVQRGGIAGVCEIFRPKTQLVEAQK